MSNVKKPALKVLRPMGKSATKMIKPVAKSPAKTKQKKKLTSKQGSKKNEREVKNEFRDFQSVMLENPKIVLEDLTRIHADIIQTIKNSEDVKPTVGARLWACYYHYNCAHRCEKQACVFTIIFKAENWLINNKLFEMFLFQFKRDNKELFQRFSKGKNDE